MILTNNPNHPSYSAKQKKDSHDHRSSRLRSSVERKPSTQQPLSPVQKSQVKPNNHQSSPKLKPASRNEPTLKTEPARAKKEPKEEKKVTIEVDSTSDLAPEVSVTEPDTSKAASQDKAGELKVSVSAFDKFQQKIFQPLQMSHMNVLNDMFKLKLTKAVNADEAVSLKAEWKELQLKM